MCFETFGKLFANRDKSGMQSYTEKQYVDSQKHLGTCEELPGILKLKSNSWLVALSGTCLVKPVHECVYTLYSFIYFPSLLLFKICSID